MEQEYKFKVNDFLARKRTKKVWWKLEEIKIIKFMNDAIAECYISGNAEWEKHQ